MNIDEIREKRAKLVDDIQNLLVEFYDETGVAITEIRVDDESPVIVTLGGKPPKKQPYLPRVFLELRI